jgi:hypothetical protein
MDREPIDDRDDLTPTDPSDDSEGDVEGHNFEFYRQEARQRAKEAEAIAREAARAREARSRSKGAGRP